MQSAMEEQTRYWMWTRSKMMMMNGGGRGAMIEQNSQMIPNGSTMTTTMASYESWEEKAFAEDSAAHLGGCVWPPRSYSCSFCRREFRSAQALGGHMNVHRRDRARLKQPPSPPPSENGDEHQLFPSQVCSSVLDKQNPNPNPNSGGATKLIPLSFSSVVSPSSLSSSYVNSIHIPLMAIPELTLGRENSKRRLIENCRFDDNEEDEIVRKRHKIDHHNDGKQVLDELRADDHRIEELDLELRLGDRPKAT